MRQADVKRHWERLAHAHGASLNATTKTSTIKRLELDALERALRRAGIAEGRVLEAGCGNGWNCVRLAMRFPGLHFTGFDYVHEMIENARSAAVDAGLADAVRFEVGDLFALDDNASLAGQWDAIFTDRCLINVLDVDLQMTALEALADRLPSGETFIVLENVIQTYRRQNTLRELVGLPARVPAAHNRFLDDDVLLARAEPQLELISVDDFGSLHDLILYVVVPLLSGGEIDYDHPLVECATELSLAGRGEMSGFDSLGQNRLYSFRKRG